MLERNPSLVQRLLHGEEHKRRSHSSELPKSGMQSPPLPFSVYENGQDLDGVAFPSRPCSPEEEQPSFDFATDRGRILEFNRKAALLNKE